MIKDLLNKQVMIRTYSAGVHYGTLEQMEHSKDGFYPVKLINSRRVYSWTGACSLSQLAVDGSTEDTSKISVVVPSIYLNAIEVIEMTDKAYTNLNNIQTWKK